MREILFKAKTWGGKWVQGDLIQLQSTTCIHSYENFMRVSDEVDPNTICQFTGLTDKNGKRIWENDIVTIDGKEENFSVDWENEDDTAMYILLNYREGIIYNFDGIYPKDCNVIGNIFDNPELLEEKR